MSSPEIENFVGSLKLKGKTLEVGSMDLNGSVKRFFKDYVGLDMRRGKNVNILGKANYLPFKSNSFQNVLCLETLEHDSKFWESIPEMIRVLKPGGRFVLTVPSFFMGPHYYPDDYWRFTESSVKELLRGLKKVWTATRFAGSTLFLKHKFEDNKENPVINTDVVWGQIRDWKTISKFKHEGYTILPISGIFAHAVKPRVYG